MPGTDRYLRTGEAVPAIYWGNLTFLSRAIADTHLASARHPGRHVLFAVSGRTRRPLQVWEDGVMTWVATRPDAEEEM